MSMQPLPHNPIEKRKHDVRVHSRNALLFVGGGVAGGVILGLIATSWFLLGLGLVIAVVGGGWQWSKVKKAVNGRDS